MSASSGDVVEVRTADNVAVVFEVAGLGSRILAQVLDLLIVALGDVVLVVGLVALFSVLAPGAQGASLAALLASSVVLLDFGLYFTVVEGFTGGRTPGKRALRLRVVTAEGAAIGLSEALVRNLLRIVDMLGIGPVMMFFDARARRLGDLAAGTMVIRERGNSRRGLRVPLTPSPVALRWGLPGPPLPGLDRLGRHEHGVLRGFLSRRDLHPLQRRRIAEQMAVRLLDRMQLPATSPDRTGDPEQLLERVWLQLDQRISTR